MSEAVGNHPSAGPDAIVLKVMRQKSMKAMASLKVVNDPSYSRNCVRCKESIVVSGLAEAMNLNVPPVSTHVWNIPEERRFNLVYVCDVCLPTPIPKYTPSSEDGPHKA